MSLGICPNCINQLTDESTLATKPSSIFKGNNIYLMCKNCQQVLLYNVDRNLIFDLDEYKEDENVIEEINRLLSEIDNHYEVAPSCEPCSHNCSTCSGCDTQYQRVSNKERKAPKQEEFVSPVEEEKQNSDVVKDILSISFLAVNKKDPAQKKILTEQDFNLINVDEWLFFELKHVTVNPIVTYEIVRN